MITRRLTVTVLLFVLMGGCGRKDSHDEGESPSSSQAVVAVKTTEIVSGSIDVVATATGKTEALRTIKVFSPIAGRIMSMKVLAGTYVKAGDILATIQTRESLGAVAGAEALMQSASTPLEKEDARRALDLANATIGVVTVRSRFGGVVSARNVSEGELVGENAELLTLLDLSTVVFMADMMLRDLPVVHVGQSAVVRFPSLANQKFKARVEAINPQSDIQSQTVQARLRFEESPASLKSIKVDMAGTAGIIISTHKNILLVPKSTLLRNDETGINTIVLFGANSLSKIVPVQIAAVADSMAEITGEGLHAGLKIVTEGNYALADSVRLRVAGSEAK